MFDYLYTLYREGKFYLKMYWLKQASATLNHFLLILTKILLDMPYTKGESDIDTYNDVRTALKGCDYWPFMWKVSKPKQKKVLVEGKTECECFSSYSYLSLLRNKNVQIAAADAANNYSSGCVVARMIGGNMPIAEEFERELGQFFGRDNSLVMTSGFLACMSAIAASVKKGDLLIADKLVHASLRTGIKLAKANGAEVHYFPHNDYKAAERILQNRRRKCKNAFLVMESVYSMHGSLGRLDDADRLRKEYDVKIILDEAHGLGTIGKTGRGLEEYYDLHGSAYLIVGSLTKSLATTGGYIVGDEKVIRYMEFFGLGNMFSAPLSAYHIGAARRALQELREKPEMVEQLQANAAYFFDSLKVLEAKTRGKKNQVVIDGVRGVCVMAVVFPGNFLRVVRLAHKLKDMGFLVSAVVAPACELERGRFRITAQTDMTFEAIDRFVSTLEELNETKDESLEFSMEAIKAKVLASDAI